MCYASCARHALLACYAAAAAPVSCPLRAKQLRASGLSADNVFLSHQALFPDNSYSVDSGGNPSVIPDLTFEEFKVRHSASVGVAIFLQLICRLVSQSATAHAASSS